MKRTALITIVLATALLLAGTAQAEFLFYNPAYYAAKAETGKAVTMPFTVTISGLSSPAGVTFIDSVKSGNLPASWLSASPHSVNVDASRPAARTSLTITVPSNTRPGIYSGFVLASVSDLEGGADPGRGAYITVTVTAAAPACSDSPDIEVTSVSPQEINVPNNRPVDVTIMGSVNNPEGCAKEDLKYQVADEYGTDGSTGSFSIDTAGEFTMTVPLDASRSGKDKDGRTYGITLTAENEAGISARTVNVNVLHDRR